MRRVDLLFLFHVLVVDELNGNACVRGTNCRGAWSVSGYGCGYRCLGGEYTDVFGRALE